MTKSINIELTTEQYKKLVELVYLGNWMANAVKTGEILENEYEQIEHQMFSYSKDAELGDFVSLDDQYGEYVLSDEVEDKMQQLIREYDDFTFWQELTYRLAERDLYREIGPVSKLTEQHHERKFQIVEQYEFEFKKSGLRQLILKKDTN